MQMVTTNVGNPMKKNNFVGIVKIVNLKKIKINTTIYCILLKVHSGDPFLGLPRWHSGKIIHLPMQET